MHPIVIISLMVLFMGALVAFVFGSAYVLAKIQSKAEWKPHVYRSELGHYYIRAWKLNGRHYLGKTWSGWKFDDFKSAKEFRTLEDATQAFEAYQEQQEEQKQIDAQRAERRKEAKKASGVVHRF